MAIMNADILTKVDKRIGKFVPGLLDCEKQFEINTPLRVAHFLAQLSVESIGFTAISEHMRYSTASQVHAAFKRIPLKEAMQYTTATATDVYWNALLLKGDGYLIKALRDDLPSAAQDRREALEIKAYGKVGAKGAGLMQITKGTKKSVLQFLCREYMKSTGPQKPKPLRIIETLQGIAPDGQMTSGLESLAEGCTTIDDFVDSFDSQMSSDPYVAAVSAGAFWYRSDLNDYADDGADDDTVKDISALVNTGKLNGTPNNLGERIKAFRRIWTLFDDTPVRVPAPGNGTYVA